MSLRLNCREYPVANQRHRQNFLQILRVHTSYACWCNRRSVPTSPDSDFGPYRVTICVIIGYAVARYRRAFKRTLYSEDPISFRYSVASRSSPYDRWLVDIPGRERRRIEGAEYPADTLSTEPLANRELVQLRWERPAETRTIWSLSVGPQAYVLFFDGVEYHVIAAITPNNSPELYRVVISTLLQNPHFVPVRPAAIKSYRPDIKAADLTSIRKGETSGLGAPVYWMDSDTTLPKRKPWKRFLSEIFVGWIGRWLKLPQIGFWHEEAENESGNTADNRTNEKTRVA
jgi:hypothetical protein